MGNSYGRETAPSELVSTFGITIDATGFAHALVARWAVWAADSGSRMLTADSDYFGRSLTWTHYAQVLAAPGDDPGILDPVPVQFGETWKLQVTVLQGTAKVTGAAGPEFSLR